MQVTKTYARFATLAYDINQIKKHIDRMDKKIQRALELEREAIKDDPSAVSGERYAVQEDHK